MVKQKKHYNLQDIGLSVDGLVDSVASLTEMVGTMAVEQTVMKDDITELKEGMSVLNKNDISLSQHVIRLELKTDGIINDARAFRAEMAEFREETENNFAFIHEDLDAVLPDHEVRIAVLEGQPIEALGL